MNPFVVGAEQYARGRPYHHLRTVRRALGSLPPEARPRGSLPPEAGGVWPALAPVAGDGGAGPPAPDAGAGGATWAPGPLPPGSRPIGSALDVACGTGSSVRALVELGWAAVGVDAVPAMVALARAATGVPVAVAAAEALPFRAGAYDLVTVGSGVHWLGPRFGAEAARVLRPGGFLLLYEHAGPDAPGLRDWFRERYLPRYPAPPRGRLAADATAGPAFTPVAADRWPDPIRFDADAFTDYLMTQSNVLASPEPPASTRAWLHAELAPYLPTDITFTASYQLLRRT